MHLSHLYGRFISFLVRRVVAPAFVLVGGFVAVANLRALLPGGTILVNGLPNHDIVLRLAAVIFPLALAVLGVAIFRAKPIGRNTRDGN
jgi:hypothetical protein